MPSLHPDPGLDYFFKACRKGDSEAKAVTVNESGVRALADASEITGLPRDNFEVWEITQEEFKEFRPVVKCNQWRQLSGLCRLRYSSAPAAFWRR